MSHVVDTICRRTLTHPHSQPHLHCSNLLLLNCIIIPFATYIFLFVDFLHLVGTVQAHISELVSTSLKNTTRRPSQTEQYLIPLPQRPHRKTDLGPPFLSVE